MKSICAIFFSFCFIAAIEHWKSEKKKNYVNIYITSCGSIILHTFFCNAFIKEDLKEEIHKKVINKEKKVLKVEKKNINKIAYFFVYFSLSVVIKCNKREENRKTSMGETKIAEIEWYWNHVVFSSLSRSPKNIIFEWKLKHSNFVWKLHEI